MRINRIICFGDSLTYGWDPTLPIGGQYDSSHRWPDIIGNKLGCNTVNLGMPGREIPRQGYATDCAVSEIRKHSPSDLLIIMLGTNDLLNSYAPDERRVSDKMKTFVERLQQEFCDTPILLISPPRVNIGLIPAGVAVERLSSLYSSLSKCKDLAFLDASAIDLPLAFDGIHLTESANVLLAEEILIVLGKIIE